MLPDQAQALPACDENLQLWRESEKMADIWTGDNQVLEIVEYEQHRLPFKPSPQALRERFACALLHSERLRDRPKDQVRVRERRQRDEKHAISEIFDKAGRDAKGEPRLARAANAGQSDQAHVLTPEQCPQLDELALTADERTRLSREVRVAETPQGRELLGSVRKDELEEPFGLGQILEAVLAQVAQFVGRFEQHARCP